jgi:hypothetical protein
MRDVIQMEEDDPDDEDDLDARINQALTDLDAGKGIPGHIVMAKLRARAEQRRPARHASRAGALLRDSAAAYAEVPGGEGAPFEQRPVRWVNPENVVLVIRNLPREPLLLSPRQRQVPVRQRLPRCSPWRPRDHFTRTVSSIWRFLRARLRMLSRHASMVAETSARSVIQRMTRQRSSARSNNVL